VDRAALDFALSKGIPCGGWCPAGRESESGPIPGRYPLREVETDDYDERTRRNVRDSDATLVIIAGSALEKGTRITVEWAEKLDRPFFILDLEHGGEPGGDRFGELVEWIGSLPGNTLNVAGNRETTSPGIGKACLRLLERLFG
jgi:hypothetical protein